MPETVSFTLSDGDVAFLREHAARHMPSNEAALKAQVGQRLAELQGILGAVPTVPDFVADFVDNLRTLHEMLCDDAAELSDQTRPWILYALNYLVDPVDTIPDTVPLVGYLDDVVVVGWVCNMLRGEIKAWRRVRQGV